MGESGCGKSMTALSLMRLIPDPPGRIVSGTVKLGGRDLLKLSEEEMRRVRGNEISMIFQEPMTSLNPVMTIGKQIAEALILHRDMDQQGGAASAPSRCSTWSASPSPQQRAKEYPHQLSGGMRQRAMIAMALACNPKVLIADEPTTALDVTIQAQILELIVELQREFGAAVILITHDLGVVAETARRVIVMYAGRKVEEATVGELFARPLHPYTRGPAGLDPAARPAARRGQRAPPTACRRSPASCRRCSPCRRAAPSRRAARAPTISAARERPAYEEKRPATGRACWHHPWLTRQHQPVLEVTDLKKHFPVRKGLLRRTVGQVYAVDGVSFTIGDGRDAGPGGRERLRQDDGRPRHPAPDRADRRASIEGAAASDITQLTKTELRPYRRQMQIVFQDPFSSLNPRMTAGDIVGEPLLVHGVANAQGTRASGWRRCSSGSGCGRRRWPTIRTSSRAASASASASPARSRSGPKLIVGDEPVSALDVSIQAQVINLLQDLQRERQLSYLFISHNLAVVEHISHRIAVMYLGRIVEHADTRSIFTRAAASLYRGAAVGRAGARPGHQAPEARAAGRRAEPGQPAVGLPLPHPLPLRRRRAARSRSPSLREIAPGHHVSCHLR